MAPLLLGVWAAAVAVTPDTTTRLLLAAPAVLIPLVIWTMGSPERWVTCFLASAWLLPPLPVALGDSGPHVCLVFAALGLLAGVLWLPRWRVPSLSLNAALVGFLTVLLLSVASAAVHSSLEIAAGSFARVVLFGIAIYVFFFTAYGPGSSSEPLGAVRIFYWAAVASALFACVDFYFQFPAPAGYGPQFIWLDSGIYRRAQGVFYEASTLGNFCAFFLVMIAVCWSRPREQAPVSRKALAVGGAVFFGALVLSYSRSSVVNILTALAVLAWLNRKRVRVARLILILVSALTVAAFLTWQLFPEFVEAYWQRLSGSALYLASFTDGVLSGRVETWRTLAQWIAAHPWETLVGIGYKTLPYTDYLGAPVVGDNMYLSLLVETGILGLGVLLWLNFAILRSSLRAARAVDARSSFFGTWMVCFWSGQIAQMFSGDLLTFWRVLPVYLWVLALAVRR